MSLADTEGLVFPLSGDDPARVATTWAQLWTVPTLHGPWLAWSASAPELRRRIAATWADERIDSTRDDSAMRAARTLTESILGEVFRSPAWLEFAAWMADRVAGRHEVAQVSTVRTVDGQDEAQAVILEGDRGAVRIIVEGIDGGWQVVDTEPVAKVALN